ncbi:MAG: diguanylate cyclase (GGDEF)-like protein [Lentisphaeria bacterium]
MGIYRNQVEPLELSVKVKDLMSSTVKILSESDSISTIVEAMATHRYSCVFVCDEGMPLGIITERDIVQMLSREIKKNISRHGHGLAQLDEICARDIMTNDPISIDQDSNIRDALSLARSRKVRHLPVVDKHQHLKGVITQAEIMEAYVSSLQHSSDLEAANQQLTLIAHEDPLLEIGNRRAMALDLSHMEARSRRSGEPYAILMIDVDYFKTYNDTLGHQEGDKALKALVKSIKINKRDIDRIYRYGGEEVLVLLPETKVKEAIVAAERLRMGIETLKIPHPRSPGNILTVSIGVAATYGGSWNGTIEIADQALYRAKQAGRNQCVSAV